MSKHTIELGALAPSITSQIGDVASASQKEVWDADADAITRLHIRGLITDAESDRARDRLLRSIACGLAAGRPHRVTIRS